LQLKNKKDMRKTILFLVLLSLYGSVVAQSQKDSISNTSDTTKVVIIPPEFKGGNKNLSKYITDNFVYPADAKRRSVEGKIEIEFTVEKSGDLTYIGVVRGLDRSVDKEIVNLFKAMPRWTPATKNGQPVRYKIHMPLKIRASRVGEASASTEGLEFMNESLLEMADRRDAFFY
jgi:protein TonB